MKNSALFILSLVILISAITFTSCEKENFETVLETESLQIELQNSAIEEGLQIDLDQEAPKRVKSLQSEDCRKKIFSRTFFRQA